MSAPTEPNLLAVEDERVRNVALLWKGDYSPSLLEGIKRSVEGQEAGTQPVRLPNCISQHVVLIVVHRTSITCRSEAASGQSPIKRFSTIPW